MRRHNVITIGHVNGTGHHPLDEAGLDMYLKLATDRHQASSYN